MKMDLYTACSIAEGFADSEPNPKQELEAWAYLIKTGYCWQLQGWYGRTAKGLIERGLINSDGSIPESTYNKLENRNE